MLLGCAVLPLGLVAVALLAATEVSSAAWAGILATWFGLGAATALVLTPSARLLRRASDVSNRPAVFAAHFSLSHACFILTYPLAGILGSLLGLATTALVLAAIAAAAAVGAARAWPRAVPVRPDEMSIPT